jgi:hypothetical protein
MLGSSIFWVSAPLKQIELCDAHLKALASERPVVTFWANPRAGSASAPRK